MKKGTDSIVKFICGCAIALVITGCSASTPKTIIEVKQVDAPQQYAQEIPGVVKYIWEQPMVDVIDVPPGLDPEGIYYRPSHQSVVEIRQGRWQYYRADGAGQ